MSNTITIDRALIEHALEAYKHGGAWRQQPAMQALRAALDDTESDSTESAYQRGYMDGMSKGRKNAALDHAEQYHYMVPHGWKLVPVEPTLEMSIAFGESFYAKERCIDDDQISDWWGAMLSAAPQPPRDQPPRKPLTRQQIQQLVIAVCDKLYPQDGESYSEADSVFYGALAHVIERTHGIGINSQIKSRMCPSTFYECRRECGDGHCKDFADAHGIGGKA